MNFPPFQGASARFSSQAISTIVRLLVGTSWSLALQGCGDAPSGEAVPSATTSDTGTAVVADVDAGEASRNESSVPQATGVIPGPPVPPEVEFTPVERIVVTGATVLSDLHVDDTGEWVAFGLEDTTVVIENGVVTGLVPASNFQLGPGDVTVTARGRWVMPAPIVVGTAEDVSGVARWLEGGRLVDATLAGIGSVVLPAAMADGPHGRCAAARLSELEIPAATVFGVDDETMAALDGVPALDASLTPAAALGSVLQDAIEAGRSSAEIIGMLTTAPGAALGRPTLAAIEPGSVAKVLVLDDNPLEDPTTILRPHAVTFGDRVMRRAEIEVLRDASDRGADMRATLLALAPEGVETEAIRRWTLSTQAQVFGGIAAGRAEDGLRFAGRTGQPRFDQTSGVLRLETEGTRPNLELDYDGPPESFVFSATPGPDGVSIALSVEGRPAIEGDSPGPNGPPIVDLALDLDVRASMLTAAEPFVLELQELIYGSGPIGLTPRRYRFTPVDPSACPPCFDGFEQVWRIEVIDLEFDDVGRSAAFATVGMRDGRPSRARFDAGAEPVWFDELPAVGRPVID